MLNVLFSLGLFVLLWALTVLLVPTKHGWRLDAVPWLWDGGPSCWSTQWRGTVEPAGAGAQRHLCFCLRAL